MADICVLSPETDEETKVLENGNFKFVGNQAEITCSPSPDFDFGAHGVWLAKTYPVVQKSFFAGLRSQGTSQNPIPGFNPNAERPTVGLLPNSSYPGVPGQPNIYKSPNACEYIIPSWPTDQLPNGQGSFTTALDVTGAQITDILVKRKPVQKEDGTFGFPDSKPALSVDIGCYGSPGFQFALLDTVTIPAGQDSVLFTKDYIACPLFRDTTHRGRLIVRCPEPVDVEAKSCAAFITAGMNGTLTAVPNSATGVQVGPTIGQPLLAAHYNDTEALLNLL